MSEPTETTWKAKSEKAANAINLYGRAFLTVCSCLVIVGTVFLVLAPTLHLFLPITACLFALASAQISITSREPSKWPRLNAVSNSRFAKHYVLVASLVSPVITVCCILPMTYYGNNVWQNSITFSNVLCLFSWSMAAMMWLQLNRQLFFDWVGDIAKSAETLSSHFIGAVDSTTDNVTQQAELNRKFAESVKALTEEFLHTASQVQELRDLLIAQDGNPQPKPPGPAHTNILFR